MSEFSPTARFDPAGGTFGNPGQALFNAAMGGNSLAKSINERAADEHTLASRINALNDHNANESAWDRYNAAQAQAAHNAFGQLSDPNRQGQNLTLGQLIALNGQKHQNGTINQGLNSTQFFGEHQLHLAQQTPEWQQHYQDAISAGLPAEAAQGVANNNIFGQHPELFGHYQNSQQFHQDNANLQTAGANALGLATRTGNYDPFNHQAQLTARTGNAYNGISNIEPGINGGNPTTHFMGGGYTNAPASAFAVTGNPNQDRDYQNGIYQRDFQNSLNGATAAQQALNGISQDELAPLRQQQLMAKTQQLQAQAEHYRTQGLNPFGVPGAGVNVNG